MRRQTVLEYLAEISAEKEYQIAPAQKSGKANQKEVDKYGGKNLSGLRRASGPGREV